MTPFQTLLIEEDPRGIVTVTLNNTEKRNALSPQMIEELTQLAADLSQSQTARVVVLCGAGKVFCAGGDLEWMRSQMHADRERRKQEARKLAQMLRVLNELPLPLIGKIHGGAFGGGVGLACVCDVTIASDETKFGLTETRLGLIPATIGPYVIARISEGPARRIFMSSRVFDAQEAKELGLIADFVEKGGLEARVESEVKPYLSTAPAAVAAAKAFTRSLGDRIDDAVINDSIERLADTWERPDAKAGIDAFLDKKPPPWSRS